MRFFARNADPRLVAYVDELNRNEDDACRKIYADRQEGA
jgi:hypothetical protein